MRFRFTVLVPLVLALAACGGAVPSTPDASLAPGSTADGPSAATAESDAPSSTEPTGTAAACDRTTAQLVVTLRGGAGFVSTTVPLTPDSAATATPEPPSAGELVSGRSYTLTFKFDLDGSEVTVAPDALGALVVTPQGNAPAQVVLGVDRAEVSLPPGTGESTLILDATFHTGPCSPVEGSASFVFDLVPASAADACPQGHDQYTELLAALDLRIGFATTVVPTQILSYAARFGPESGADGVPAFAGFDPSAPAVSVAAGGMVQIDLAAADMTLTGASIETWRRSDVVGSDGLIARSYGDRIDFQAPRAPDGVAAWSAPAESGEYIVGITPEWSEACVRGSSYTYLSVTVR